jgi:monovalent cation:H+ antiporter, CPA1 family
MRTDNQAAVAPAARVRQPAIGLQAERQPADIAGGPAGPDPETCQRHTAAHRRTVPPRSPGARVSEIHIIAVLTTMAALFAWLNERYARLPTAIGLMLTSMLLSIALVALGRAGFAPVETFTEFVAAIDFDEAVLHGMLGALLFAGALHMNLDDMLREKGVIALLATIGVTISTFVVGTLTFLVFGWLGLDVPLLWCLLFGAIVSPTDPIAVGAILKSAGVPTTLRTKITGESLFNDGVGVVVFLLLLGLATGAREASVLGAVELFVVEVFGGLAFGAIVGMAAYYMLRTVDNYTVEILITLAVVTGGYVAANELHLSGPLAMVVAGLLLGNRGRAFAMSPTTRERVDSFWEMIDEFLNAVLFVLIGVEVVAVDFEAPILLAGALTIPIVLLARWLSVGAPVLALRVVRDFSPHVVKVLTWSGLKGGISVALALSLPPGPYRELIITAAYIVVAFSIIVQGLTVGPVVRALVVEERLAEE